jgi:hypothetical protein
MTFCFIICTIAGVPPFFWFFIRHSRFLLSVIPAQAGIQSSYIVKPYRVPLLGWIECKRKSFLSCAGLYRKKWIPAPRLRGDKLCGNDGFYLTTGSMKDFTLQCRKWPAKQVFFEVPM